MFIVARTVYLGHAVADKYCLIKLILHAEQGHANEDDTHHRATVPFLNFVFLSAVALAATGAEEAPENQWPREINIPQGVVVIYQPQPEKLEGDILTARTAIAVELKDREQPIFGAVWLSARLDTDRVQRIATMLEVEVTNIRIPNEDESKSQKLAKLLETEMPKWQLPISMGNLLATLEVVDARQNAAESISTEPPKIVFTTKPAVLILTDGKPQLRDVEGSNLQRVINTPFTILFDKKAERWYLHAESDVCYVANAVQGDWKMAADVPADVRALAPPPPGDDEGAVLDAQMPQTAAVERSEASLEVEYDGTPVFQQVEGTSLNYAVNTATPVIRADGKYYAVDEAVWFESVAPEGQWVVASEIPASIYTIPPESPLYYVTFVRVYKSTDDYVYVGYTPGYTNTYVYNTTVVYGTGYYYPG